MSKNFSSTTKTLYLYARVSTEKQSKDGRTGLDRQKEAEAVKRTIEKFKDMPRKYMEDTGKSAYHGKNISEGELGVFLDLCKMRQVAKGSIIAIENIDRLTRLGLTDAQQLVIEIMQAGVDIYIWTKDKIYTRNNVADTITLAIELEQAGKYSQDLSYRITTAAIKKIELIKSGKKDNDGHCYALRGYGHNKWWVDTSSGYVKPHDEYFSIAREIVDLNLEGFGHIKIRQALEEKGYKSPRTAHKKKGVNWGQNMIAKFHTSKTLLGEFRVNIKGEEHIIPDYYPPVCTPEEFAQIQNIKKAKRAGGTKRNAALFSGFGKTRCAFCDNTIQTFLSKAGSKYETQRYKCCGKDDPSIKCISSTIDSKVLETAIIKVIGVIISQPIKEDHGFQVIEIEQKIKEAQSTINGLAENISKAGAGAGTLISLLDKETETKIALENDLSKLKQIPDIDPLKMSEISPDIINYKNTALRQKIREKIFSRVKQITIKTLNKHTEFEIELYTKNILNATVMENKYLLIKGTAIAEHLSDPGLGGTNTLIESLKWSGIDRKNNKFDLEVVNKLDFNEEPEIWSEFLDVPLAKINKN